MFAFLTSMEFLNLGLLGLLAGTPLLLLAYLKRDPRKKRIVSSLLILKTLPKRKTLRRRVKPPLRFYLELLALLLLGAASAWPVFSSDGENVAILIDSSLSMQAKAAPGISSKSRFDEALSTLERVINAESPKNRYTLFLSAAGSLSGSSSSLSSKGPGLNRLSDEPLSGGALLTLANAQKPSLSSDSIQLSVSEIAESGNFARVVIISDRQVDYLPAKGESAGGNVTVVESVLVGKPVTNAYLTGLQSDSSGMASSAGSSNVPGAESVKRLVASVGLSAPAPESIELRLYHKQKQEPESAYRLVRRLIAKLSPETISQVAFDAPTNSNGNVYKVQIAPVADSPFEDAIAADNEALLSESQTVENSVLLISPDTNTGDALGLSALRALSVRQIAPAEFAALNPAELTKFSLLIFHKTAPGFTPTVPTLLVLPPSRNPIFPVVGEIASPRITSWAEESPITSYLRIGLIKPTAGLVFQVPNWAQSIMNSEPGAIIVAGESRGVRFAGVGMEIFPFEGKKTPIFSVLTLNLLNYLAAKSLSVDISSGDESETWGTNPIQIQKRFSSTAPADDSKSPLWPLLLQLAALVLATELLLRTVKRFQQA